MEFLFSMAGKPRHTCSSILTSPARNPKQPTSPIIEPHRALHFCYVEYPVRPSADSLTLPHGLVGHSKSLSHAIEDRIGLRLQANAVFCEEP